MVSRRLRVGERRFGRNPLRGRFERRLLRVGAGADRVASSRPGRCFPAAAGHRHRGRHDKRHSDHPLCIPGRRLAAGAELLIGRECVDRRYRARRGDALPQLPASRIGRSRVDGGAPAPRRACARKGDAVPDGRRAPPCDRNLCHHGPAAREATGCSALELCLQP